MTRKPCRNSRYIGDPRTITLPDGHVIVEREFELTPGYGRTNVLWNKANGWSPDMQTEQYEQVWKVAPPEIRRWKTDPDNPECPLSRFVGNAEAKKIVQRAAYAALGRPNHCCADLSFAMVGPASSGKTTLARLFCETVRLPFIEVPPRGIRDSREFFDAIAVTLERFVNTDTPGDPFSLKMVMPDPRVTDDPTMLVPPCVVFIDEVHGLPKNLRENLLQAIEAKDRRLTIEGGWQADCANVCWIVATTERGKLFGPFDSRFLKVELDMYGPEEIAAIVNLDNPGWNLPLCRLAARYAGRVPREALDFAKAMEQEHDLNGGDWESVAARVARSLRIDKFGLTRRRLNVLVALGQVGATSKGRLCDYAGCQLEELEKSVMPALLVATPEDPAMVAVTSRGYAVTRRGLEELDRRGIPHRGEEVVAEGGRRLDFGSWNPDDFGVDEEEAVVQVPKPVAVPEPVATPRLSEIFVKRDGPRTATTAREEMIRWLEGK